MAFTIVFEKEKCMGCGACTTCDNWKMGDDRKVYPVKTQLEELGCNETAAEICPINIISFKEE